MESIEKHIDSNPVQFFIGGAIVDAKIENGNLIGIITNHTSRNSLFLHVADNYDRKDGDRPLSTITQVIHFTLKVNKGLSD